MTWSKLSRELSIRSVAFRNKRCGRFARVENSNANKIGVPSGSRRLDCSDRPRQMGSP